MRVREHLAAVAVLDEPGAGVDGRARSGGRRGEREGRRDDEQTPSHRRNGTRSPGRYLIRICWPTLSAFGFTSGFSCSSAPIVVPSAAAMLPNVSPDWIV